MMGFILGVARSLKQARMGFNWLFSVDRVFSVAAETLNI